jgi:hypothetical protein
MTVRSKPLNDSQKQEILSQDPSSTATGSVARYAQLNSDTGVKLYRDKQIRDMCFARQEIANGLDFGPKCWHPFRLRIWGVLWHGFYTEHATLAGEFPRIERDCGQSKLRDKMETHFRGLHDLSYENWGQVRGKWVVIDFSHLEDKYGSIDTIRPQWRKSECMERYKSVY